MKTIELKIEKPAYGGYGIGYHDGKVCFVSNAVPGDEALVGIYREKKDYSFGKIVKIKSEIIPKIKPACPNFGICGGCSYLNLPYEAELGIKKDILTDSIVRIAGIQPGDIPEISIVNGERFNYRSHASVKSAGGKAGFFMRESNRIVPFPEGGCRLLAGPIIAGLSGDLTHNAGDFRIACSHNGDIVFSYNAERMIRETECDIIYERDIDLFFQANRLMRAGMLSLVSEYAGLKESDSFLDIGCGVGFFTLRMAMKAKYGYGIDVNADSIKWAEYNARLNRTGNVAFKAKSASEAALCGNFNIVILDPPRAGIEKNAREALSAISPERIVYVSCNPATFARDARDILSNDYSLTKLALIDMFPATHHIELISLFIKER